MPETIIECMNTHMVRISARVQSHLSGSDAWQSGQRSVERGYERQSTVDMMNLIKNARTYADGSVRVDLTPEQCDTLYACTECMEIGGHDNAHDSDGRADMNAARALLRQLEKTTR